MKTVQNLRNSLKFKAPVEENALAIIIKGRAYLLMGSAVRVLSSDKHAYVSAAAFSHIVEIGDDRLEPLPDETPADDLEKELAPRAQAAQRRGAPAPEIPEELLRALQQSIPAGYGLQMVDGEAKLVKKRNRSKNLEPDVQV
jgi:hypothetical protein